MSIFNPSGQAMLTNSDHHHEIEAQQRQVGQIVLTQRLPGQVSVDTAQPAQTTAASTIVRQVGDHDLTIVSDDHIPHRTATVDYQSDLTPDLQRLLGKIAGQLRRNDLIAGHPSSIDPLQRLDLAGF